MSRQRVDEETLARIERELGDDGVWVAPALRDEVPPAVEARLEKAVAQRPTPTYVTLVELDYDDPLTHGDAAELANYVVHDTGRDGLYLGLAPRYDADDPFRLELTSFPEDPGLFYVAGVASAEHPDDPGAQVLRAFELIRTGDAERLYDELGLGQPTGGSGGSGDGSGDGADGGGMDTGAVLGLGAALLVGALGVVGMARLRRRRRGSSPARSAAAGVGAFTLPRAVLSTVRAEEDRRLEARARADVLALGEAIDRTDLDAQRRGSLASWQAALDHYDVAGRILDREHSPADTVGAIVLAARGRAALAAAARGRTWAPTPGCYFNPLHAGRAGPVRWQDGDARVRVPACATCAAAVREGREPDDVLDFVAEGRPVHYFRLDLGAWSHTGYGSLDPDLLGRLLRRDP